MPGSIHDGAIDDAPLSREPFKIGQPLGLSVGCTSFYKLYIVCMLHYIALITALVRTVSQP